MPEIKLALEKGYKVTKIYEEEASGYPAWCKTKEDQQKYIDDYLQKQGIQLDAEKIIYNEGLRCVAKLMLNSLWGKFGQKNNQKQHITINVEEDPDQYYNIMFNDAYVIHDIVDYNNQRTIDMSYSLKKIVVKDDKNTSIYIAAYTTAMARCKLYNDMDNTYATQLPYGDYLGNLTDELKKDHIDEWVSGGPKNYSYVTRKGKAKTVCKGFALSYENSLQLGHHNMKDIVFGKEDAVAFKFRKIAVSRTHVVSNKQKPIVIENENSSKKYPFVYDKRLSGSGKVKQTARKTGPPVTAPAATTAPAVPSAVVPSAPVRGAPTAGLSRAEIRTMSAAYARQFHRKDRQEVLERHIEQAKDR
ncbi:DNA-directed DNA polymerase, partial [Powellomyces hirtus]